MHLMYICSNWLVDIDEKWHGVKDEKNPQESCCKVQNMRENSVYFVRISSTFNQSEQLKVIFALKHNKHMYTGKREWKRFKMVSRIHAKQQNEGINKRIVKMIKNNNFVESEAWHFNQSTSGLTLFVSIVY